MKYAIKHDDDYVTLCKGFENNPGSGFDYYSRIDIATHFNSITDAITAIQRRLEGNLPKLFTIVGIKEVSTPRYEEVVL